MGECGLCIGQSSNPPPTMEADEKSGGNGAVEEEEEEDTTMVMTCEGNISDPHLNNKLSCLMHRLRCLARSGK